MSITSKDWWTKCWKPGPSCSSSFSTCCPILGSLQLCPGRGWTGSSLSYALNKRHTCGETGMAEETWPTKSLVGHCVITTTRKCWPRLEAKTTRTSSTFNSLSDTMDIEVDHLSLFISPLANSQYMIPSFAACNCDAFPVSHPTKRFFPQFSTTVWTCRKRIRQIELFSTVNRYTFSASSARFIKSILDKVCLWTEWTFPFGADSLFSSAHCAPDENDRPSDHEQTLNL